MNASENAEAFVGMLRTTDILHEVKMGMYLMHMWSELQEQSSACKGEQWTGRAVEMNPRL